MKKNKQLSKSWSEKSLILYDALPSLERLSKVDTNSHGCLPVPVSMPLRTCACVLSNPMYAMD